MARPKPESKNVVLSVQIPETLRDALKEVAFDKRMEFPEFLREILTGAVRSHDKKKAKEPK
jgi:hypothetical protein